MAKINRMTSRKWWTLKRFGLSPEKVAYRLVNHHAPKVLCISIPKAGTHLLERALCLHPRLHRKLAPTINDSNIKKWGELSALLEKLCPGQMLVSHLQYSSERLRVIKSNGVKCLFMIRDPRDIVVSQTFYILNNKTHHQHEVFASQADLKNRLKIAIMGNSPTNLPSIGQRLECFAGWLESSALIVRYEDLIGPEGIGDRQRQLEALQSIYDFIQVDLTHDQAIALSRQLFSSSSPTFRSGAIGRWRDCFDSEIKDLFKKVAGEAMIRYGYEKDHQW
jgi:hypothetical protein